MLRYGLVLVLCVAGVASSDFFNSKSVLEIIWSINRLRGATEIIQKCDMSHYYELPNITVFVPSHEFIRTFSSTTYGINMSNANEAKSLFLYHIVKGQVLQDDLINGQTYTTMHPSGFQLTANIFTDEFNRKVYSVNGFSSIIISDLVGTNGVVHIIDRVIAPIPSTKTLHDYLLYPDVPNMAFVSIARASIVDPSLKQRTNSTSYQFTAFSPPDSVLFPMPEYGQVELFNNLTVLNMTIHAHIVQGETQYIPTRGHVPDMNSLEGRLKVYKENGAVYVINNYVRGRILMANIPVANGVLHVVDNLLFFKYMNLIQTLNATTETSAFTSYINQLPSTKLNKLTDPLKRFTIFAPTNTAFAKIPIQEQEKILLDPQLRLQVTEAHIVDTDMIDSSSFKEAQQINTINNYTINFKIIRGEAYLETGGMLSKVVRADIGCTNGIIHLISNVLQVEGFTVLDAIKGNNQLTHMKNNLTMFPELEKLLNNEAGSGQITVFLPSDVTLSQIPTNILQRYYANPTVFLNAIKGHIIEGEVMTSMSVYDTVSKYSYGGTELDITNTGKGFTVVGSHIRARVVIKDIWCSNGVLHVIDNLLHLPSRNILDELERHRDTNAITSFLKLQTMQELSKALNDENSKFTMFVPSDETIINMPRTRVDVLLQNTNLFEKVISAHVFSNGSRYINELFDGDSYTAEIGIIHVSRQSTDVFVSNNNVKRKVIRSNIRATNGIIHVVDGLLYFPFYSLAEVLYNNARIFYDMITTLTEFSNWMNDEGTKLTLFVPSDEYLNSSSELQTIKDDQSILRRIFISHVIRGTVLDSEYLEANLKQNYNMKNQYNVTFSVKRQQSFAGASIDVGYSNLVHDLDINRNGIAGSNGVVYLINGFLDYSFLNVMQEMQKQEKLKFSLEHILQLFPDDVAGEFEDMTNMFTIFIPANEAFVYLSMDEVKYLNSLQDGVKKMELLDRHVIKGAMLDINQIKSASQYSERNELGVMFVTRNQEVFLDWDGVETKIIQPNILAKNGIIHIVDRILFKLDVTTTTVRPTLRPPGPIGAASAVYINVVTVLLTLTLMRILTSNR